MVVIAKSQKGGHSMIGGPVTMINSGSRVRVLHVISGLGVGGAENFLLRLALSLSDGVESRIASLTFGGGMVEQFREAGVSVSELDLGSRGGLLRLPAAGVRLAKEVRAWQPQIVQGWLNHGNVVASIVRSLFARRSKLIWCIRQSFDEISLEKFSTRMAIRLQGRLSSQSDAVICNSARSQKQFAKLARSEHGLSVIPNGFDTSKFAPNSKFREFARDLMGASEQDLVVGMVARYHAMKDYPCFIEALGRAVHSVPHLRAVCIGTGVASVDSPLRPLIAKWGLEGRCTLLDERTDLERIYPGIDLLCLTSRWGEGFPNVLGEAMACGVPCVATDVGDAVAVVGDTGYLVRPGDAREVAEVIVAYSELARDARFQLGERAMRRITDLYSMSAVAEKYMNVYRELLAFS